MGINKVNYGNTTLIDISNDTVTAGSMLSGATAHDNSGAAITGTIASKSSSDLTASGATVTVPAGYYASAATKSVASGTAGTPTATKGTVSNHSVSVTPSVTNTSGYITGSTKTGTAVSVSASELVSGTKSISANGTGIDVTNYASVDVAVPSSTPSVRELTVTPTNEVQVFTPNYDPQHTLLASFSERSISYSPGTTHTFANALNITNGTTYIIEGTFNVEGGYGGSWTINGEWVCGESLKPLLQGSDTKYFSDLTLSSTAWYFKPNNNNTYSTLAVQIYEASAIHYDGFSKVTVNAAAGASIGTKTVTNSSSSATSLAFSELSGEPKAFFVRCLSQLTRSSSYSYYYITAVRYNGTNTYGNYWRMSNGTFYVDTSHYSFTYSNGTLTVSSSGARGSSGGSFYNGDYELTYVY